MDGQRLECKSDNKLFRTNRRSIYSLKSDNNNQSNDKEDIDQMVIYQKYASEITKDHFYMFIDFLKYKEVDFLIAPYEADSQLAFMYKTNTIDYILTEDSDLIAYGCFKIIRRLKKNGECMVLNIDNKNKKKISATILNFLEMNDIDRIRCCILSGCDYLPNVKGLAFGSLVRIITSGYDLIESVKAHIKRNNVFTQAETLAYFKRYKLAITAFTEQVVYCNQSEKLVNLSAFNNKSKTRIILKILNEKFVGKPIKNIKKFVKGELDIDNPAKKRKKVDIDFKRLVKFFDYRPNFSTGRIGNLTTELVTFDNFDEKENNESKNYRAYTNLLRKRKHIDTDESVRRIVETCTHSTKSSRSQSIDQKSSLYKLKSVKYSSL